jgi:hypothetical protein
MFVLNICNKSSEFFLLFPEDKIWLYWMALAYWCPRPVRYNLAPFGCMCPLNFGQDDLSQWAWQFKFYMCMNVNVVGLYFGIEFWMMFQINYCLMPDGMRSTSTPDEVRCCNQSTQIKMITSDLYWKTCSSHTNFISNNHHYIFGQNLSKINFGNCATLFIEIDVSNQLVHNWLLVPRNWHNINYPS